MRNGLGIGESVADFRMSSTFSSHRTQRMSHGNQNVEAFVVGYYDFDNGGTVGKRGCRSGESTYRRGCGAEER